MTSQKVISSFGKIYNKFDRKYYDYYDKFTMEGPDAEFLRKAALKTIDTKKLSPYFINKLLFTYIPAVNETISYGSWKHFQIYGSGYEFYRNINNTIKKYNTAINIIEEKFLPIWIHNAYKINGCMFKKIKHTTHIGKKSK